MSNASNQQQSFSRAPERPVHALFVGQALEAASRIFQRKDEIVRCDHAKTAAIGLDMIVAQAQVRPFDCVMVDMRHEEDGNPLNIVALAALRTFGRLTVLANPDNANEFRTMVGVDTVLVAPIEPLDIIRTIVDSSPAEDDNNTPLITIPKTKLQPPGEPQDVKPQPKPERQVISREANPDANHPAGSDLGLDKKADPEADAKAEAKDKAARSLANEAAKLQSSEKKKSTVTKGFESSLSKIQDADQQVWQRFVPLANFLYKKLAIVVLTALFLTFVVYGAMIVFFMSNSSWSMPFELSRGHILVDKAERDISSLRLRQNEIRQDLTVSRTEVAKAERQQRDGDMQLTLTKRTVEEEILGHNNLVLEITQHIGRLKEVISDFNEANGKGGFANNLEKAYSKRLITRRAMNSGTLAVLETLHRIAIVENEISEKQIELAKVDRTLEFLRSLLEEISQPEMRVITSAGSNLAHLAREVIEAKTLVATATSELAAAQDRKIQLENSLEVISANLASLENTPAARALKAPVMVLFVPYTNTANVEKGQPLYSCAFSIIVCSRVGEVGDPIDGETVSVHPLFGKPMRGLFVEASFADPRSVTEELVHAGGPPVLF